MKAVTCVGAMLGVVCGFSLVAQAQTKPDPSAVGDRDRAFLNYVREAATVGSGVLRLELRGYRSEDADNPQIDVTGLPLEAVRRSEVGRVLSSTTTTDGNPNNPPNPEKQIDNTDTIKQATLLGANGGFIDLLGSYGLGPDAEVGFDVPYFYRKVRLERTKDRVTTTTDFTTTPPTVTQTTATLTDTVGDNEQGFGDITLYLKIKHQVAEHCRIGAGVEITPPSGSDRRFLGTGELGVNPFLSTRYQNGHIGAEAHVGYFLYTGNAKDVFNYSGTVFVRPTSLFVLRVELSGRHFSDFGQKFDDVVVMPGIDFNVTDYLTLRPVGMFNISSESQDWGIGVGVAFQLPVL